MCMFQLVFKMLKLWNRCCCKLPGMIRVLVVSSVFIRIWLTKLDLISKIISLIQNKVILLLLIMAKIWRCHALEGTNLVIHITLLLRVCIIWELWIVLMSILAKWSQRIIFIGMFNMKALLQKRQTTLHHWLSRLWLIQTLFKTMRKDANWLLSLITVLGRIKLLCFEINPLPCRGGIFQGSEFCFSSYWSHKKFCWYVIQCSDTIYRKKDPHSIEELFENLSHFKRITVH